MDRVGAVPRELTEAVCLFPCAGIEDGEQCVFISAEGRVIFPQLTHIVWLTVCCNFMFFFIRDRYDTTRLCPQHFDFENDALPRQARDVRNTENTAVLRSKKLLPLFREIPDLLPNVRNRPTNTIK